MISRLLFLAIMSVSLSACQSTSKQKIFTSLGAAVGCSIVGAISTPEGEREVMHAGAWGSACGFATGLLMSGADTISDSKNLKSETSFHRSQKDLINELQSKKDIFSSKEFLLLPEEVQHKLKKGEWTLYKTGNWKLRDNKLILESYEAEVN